LGWISVIDSGFGSLELLDEVLGMPFPFSVPAAAAAVMVQNHAQAQDDYSQLAMPMPAHASMTPSVGLLRPQLRDPTGYLV